MGSTLYIRYRLGIHTELLQHTADPKYRPFGWPAGARITKTDQKTLWQLVSPIQVEQDEDGNYYVAKEAEFDRQDNATYYQYATAFPVGVTLAQTYWMQTHWKVQM